MRSDRTTTVQYKLASVSKHPNNSSGSTDDFPIIPQLGRMAASFEYRCGQLKSGRSSENANRVCYAGSNCYADGCGGTRIALRLAFRQFLERAI
jgi:hypothetical protein